MKQPIPGVSPAQLDEVTVAVVWPSLAATSWGRLWGRAYANSLGFRLFDIPITVGRLLALISIPLILPVYFHMIIPRLPFVVMGVSNPSCRRYRLTNRRLIVEQAIDGVEQRSVSLNRFDAVEVEMLPGQAWYAAGDLVFRQGQVETFRLSGVPRPETFRQTCLKTQISHAGVEHARKMGVAI